MNVLILSPYPEKISSAVLAVGDSVKATDREYISSELIWADYVVSYGYRHIIRNKAAFEKFGDRMINLHISSLPHNRGSNPVWWAVREHGPFGVTIHVLDEGLDTGPILYQRNLLFTPSAKDSPEWTSEKNMDFIYWEHRAAIEDLFSKCWAKLRTGTVRPVPQQPGGSYHCKQDMLDILE